METIAGQILRDFKKVLKAAVVAFVTILIGATSCTSTTFQVRPEEKNEEIVLLGKWTEKELNHIISKSSKVQKPDERIDFISEQFLGTPYKESTLKGDANTEEAFVINLEGMDCFTYIDYVEAMRLSNSFSEFKENLKRVRYQSGDVSFQNRNHFFTDWLMFNKENIRGVTEEVGGDKVKTVKKTLNLKEDGTYFLPGVSPKQREVTYIPSIAIEEKGIGRLRTGDYVGIYSELEGLDVSHTGIIIKDGDKVYLRHASSREKNRKVVDEDLLSYISDKPGLVVLRPK